LSAKEILFWFDICDAGWMHDGDPKKPHAELTSGKCSNGFFDCMRVLSNPRLCEIFAFQLVRELKEAGIEKPDYVIGSSYAAITFSHEVAKAFGSMYGFTEKDSSNPKKQIWRRMTIPKDSKVFQVEELISTSGTFQEVRRAVEEGNSEPINFLDVVAALIHRPPKLPASYDSRKVISLIEVEVWAVDPKDCPLCKIGSPRFRPKTNWAKLTGKV